MEEKATPTQNEAEGGCANRQCTTIDDAIAEAIGPKSPQAIELVSPSAATASSTSSSKKGRRSQSRVQQHRYKHKGAALHLRRALVAEAVGTGCIVLFGCGAVCSSFSGAFSGIWQIAVVWGIGVALAIFATADSSGAHLNPAMTLAFWIVRPKAHGMNAKRVIAYIIAQVFGAAAAAALNLVIYGSTIAAFERSNGIVRGQADSVRSAMAFGEYFPNPDLTHGQGANGPYIPEDVSPIHALLIEAWGTGVLAFVVFSVTHARNRVLRAGGGAGVPVIIGSTIALLLTLYAPLTQAGWNPARDFGPRMVAAAAGWGTIAIPGPRQGFWVYIVGPLFGGPLGAAAAEYGLNGSWRLCACRGRRTDNDDGNNADSDEENMSFDATADGGIDMEAGVLGASELRAGTPVHQHGMSTKDRPNQVLRWCWVPDPHGKYHRVLAAPEGPDSDSTD
eukprot:INCI7211.4.p1 GENE.INCI7211.4~~INCI7211.4.p1  ORF type:complete len:449 (-),score=62.25 INCI7211.4:1061-2407(-)